MGVFYLIMCQYLYYVRENLAQNSLKEFSQIDEHFWYSFAIVPLLYDAAYNHYSYK